VLPKGARWPLGHYDRHCREQTALYRLMQQHAATFFAETDAVAGASHSFVKDSSTPPSNAASWPHGLLRLRKLRPGPADRGEVPHRRRGLDQRARRRVSRARPTLRRPRPLPVLLCPGAPLGIFTAAPARPQRPTGPNYSPDRRPKVVRRLAVIGGGPDIDKPIAWRRCRVGLHHPPYARARRPALILIGDDTRCLRAHCGLMPSQPPR
jgi:hypothetical protein